MGAGAKRGEFQTGEKKSRRTGRAFTGDTSEAGEK